MDAWDYYIAALIVGLHAAFVLVMAARDVYTKHYVMALFYTCGGLALAILTCNILLTGIELSR